MIPTSTPEPEPKDAEYYLRFMGHRGEETVWQNINCSRAEYIALKVCLAAIRGEREQETAFKALEAVRLFHTTGSRDAAIAMLGDAEEVRSESASPVRSQCRHGPQ